jgi:translocation and assembly module TamB
MSNSSGVKKIVYRVGKICLKIIAGILILILILLILIQTSFFQNFARKKIESYLQTKLHTKLSIGDLDIGFPKKIILKNIYVEDLQKDTLLAGERLEINISMFKLFQHTVDIQEIGLKGITVKIKRLLPDSSFNYDFLIKAFASNSDTSKKTSSSPFKIEIDRIYLQRIAATYKDDATGNDLTASFEDFSMRIKRFDPDHLVFSVKDISLSGLRGNMRQYQPELILRKMVDTVEVHRSSSQPVSLELGSITFNNIDFKYENTVAAENMNIHMGSFRAESKAIDLQKLHISLKSAELKNTTAVIRMGKNDLPITNAAKTSNVSSTDTGWQLNLSRFDFENNSFQYDDENKKSVTAGIDYNHLKLDHFTILAKNLSVGQDEYKGDVGQIAFVEKTGFELKKLSTLFLYNKNNIQLKNLNIRTNHSDIRNQSFLKYNSTADFSNRPEQILTDIRFDHSMIAVRDVMFFVPSLSQYIKGKENSMVSLNAKIKGFLNELAISNLEMAGLGNTSLQLSGKISGLPEVKKAFFDIQLTKLITTKTDIESVIPAETIPANIRVPESLSVTGFFKGSFDQFASKASIATNKGDAELVGTLNSVQKSYDFNIITNQLDFGYILNQEANLGKISLQATLKGNGYDYKSMNSVIHAVMTQGTVRDYEYKNLKLDASLQNGNGIITSSINDPNIIFGLDASANFVQKYPAVQLKLIIDTLNPRALHLIKDSMQLKLVLAANFSNTNPDSLNGNLKIYNILLTDNKRDIQTDSILLTAENKDTAENIRFHSEMADIEWNGKYKITEVSQAIKQTISKYYSLPGNTSQAVSAQNWKMQLVWRPSPLILQLIPSLKGTDSVHADLQFNSASHYLNFSVRAPKIQYKNELIRHFEIGAFTKDTSIEYRISFRDARQGGFQLYQTSVYGHLANNRLLTTLSFKDQTAIEQFHLGGILSQIDHGLRFVFDPDSLLLDYDKWNMAKDNFVQYDSLGIVFHNLKLSHEDESLTVSSTSSMPTSPVDVIFNNFHIKTIIAFAEEDSLLMDGVLNGKAQIKNILSNPVLTADLQIKDLAYKKDTVGNITLKVNNEKQNEFSTNLTVEGKNNKIKADGIYYTGEGKMDMKFLIDKLDLVLVKPFSGGQIKDISGNLKGNIHATGTLTEPLLTGALHFDSTYITPYITGEPLKLSSDNIEFDNDGFNFSQFVMLDSAGDKAILDGNIFTKDFKNIRFDLSFDANNFRLVNAPNEINRMFYGRLNMDVNLDVTGDLNAPKANAMLRVNKQTDFTFILPSNNPEIVDRQGVVAFVDKNTKIDTVKLRSYLDSLSKNSELKGVDVAANIEIDSSAQFTMIIDERNGDALTMKGRADLTGSIDKSGKMNLTGNYELTSGAYSLQLSILKRKFIIQRGSTITWTGDPGAATVDITATYLANTPSIDLVEQQLSGLSDAQINRFKEKLPFHINLRMLGELLRPRISFSIDLPDELLTLWPEVANKLLQMRTDTSEVNKQVFAVLLLNRFVAQNPFVSLSGGLDPTLLAKQSASSILASQLNQLAATLIKGVDINFDLYSDKNYAFGQALNQTQLTVGVSKDLFNERVRVTVGSNFQLEGVNPGQNASTLAGNTIVDYRLSQDGRYVLRAYRKDQYESVVEGQVVETGVGFILTLDYNQFSDLFRNRKTVKQNIPAKHKKLADNTKSTQ